MTIVSDRRKRYIAAEHGLLIDEDQEFYRVRQDARLDVPSQVFIDFTIRMVRPRPRPQLMDDDMSSTSLFK